MGDDRPTTMLNLAEGFLKDIFKGEPPLPTFSKGLNAVLSGGLFPGRLYAVEGPPDGSKTAFAAQLVDNLAQEENVPTLFISSTLSANEIYVRALSRIARVHSGEIEGKAWLQKDWLAEQGREAPVRIKGRIKDAHDIYTKFADRIVVEEIGSTGMLVSDVKPRLAEVREHFKEKLGSAELPTVLVVVDTLRGLRYGEKGSTAEPTHSDLVKMLKELRSLARSSRCPVLALVDGVAFGRMYFKAGILPTSHGHELGFTAYHSDVTVLMETEDTLLSDAIQELFDRGQDTEGAKLEEARSRFPLSNPKIGPFVPTYARLTISTRGSGAARNMYFIYLKAIGDFLDMSFKREVRKVVD